MVLLLLLRDGKHDTEERRNRKNLLQTFYEAELIYGRVGLGGKSPVDYYY